MNSIGTAGAQGKAVDPGEDWGGEAPAAASKPWSREEAEAWRKSNPSSSPWRVVAAQAVVGLVCAAVAWAFTRQGVTAWSALYGAAIRLFGTFTAARDAAHVKWKRAGAKR